MLTIEEGYRTLRSGGIGRVVLKRDVVVVEGPDALTYLDGQLSQELGGLAECESVWSLLLEPSGKLGWWLRVTREDGERYLLDLDAGAGEGAAARLNRFKLRVKATITLAADWSFDAAERGAPWPGAVGYDTWFQRQTRGDADLDGRQVPPEALEIIRIEAGVPKMGAEITDDVIPAELGQWLIDASVSFTKGCYTGQELVARIDSRGGNVPRHLRGLVVDGDQVPSPGSEVIVDGDVVGVVTSAAFSPGLDAPVALAFVRRKVEPPAAAVIRTADGELTTEIRALPLVG